MEPKEGKDDQMKGVDFTWFVDLFLLGLNLACRWNNPECGTYTPQHCHEMMPLGSIAMITQTQHYIIKKKKKKKKR